MDNIQERLDDFFIVCQPIVCCSDTTSVDRYEVLLRSKQHNRFPEESFLWMIEEDDRNRKLMSYYHSALTKMICNDSHAKFALNLHPKQLQHPSTWQFLDSIAFLKENISIELTEHQCNLGSPEERKLLHMYLTNLRKKGFLIAIDDVGTGQNNLELVLNNIAVIDTIKLSMSAFRALDEKVLLNFLSSWLFLSETYNLKVVVEGVESERISNELKQLGVIYQQGYYHGVATNLIE
ncbi:MAG: hypothetical protein PWP61_499 [Trichococcus sp.]|nr:hypothetical protein [Trichococcus sp.]